MLSTFQYKVMCKESSTENKTIYSIFWTTHVIAAEQLPRIRRLLEDNTLKDIAGTGSRTSITDTILHTSLGYRPSLRISLWILH